MCAKPYKIIYGIRKSADRDGAFRDRWTEIGVAFQNQDGSYNLLLHYVPTNLTETSLHMRDPKPREEQEVEPQASEDTAAEEKGEEDQSKRKKSKRAQPVPA